MGNDLFDGLDDLFNSLPEDPVEQTQPTVQQKPASNQNNQNIQKQIEEPQAKAEIVEEVQANVQQAIEQPEQIEIASEREHIQQQTEKPQAQKESPQPKQTVARTTKTAKIQKQIASESKRNKKEEREVLYRELAQKLPVEKFLPQNYVSTFEWEIDGNQILVKRTSNGKVFKSLSSHFRWLSPKLFEELGFEIVHIEEQQTKIFYEAIDTTYGTSVTVYDSFSPMKSGTVVIRSARDNCQAYILTDISHNIAQFAQAWKVILNRIAELRK